MLTTCQSITVTRVLKFALLAAGLPLLSACQGMSSLATANHADSQLAVSQPKTVLSRAIEHTLYRNQDWIAEHQLYFIETADAETAKTASQGIVGCQERHDEALMSQMRQDHLKTYAQVAKLDENKRKVYDNIKQTYLDCYNQAEQQISESATNPVELGDEAAAQEATAEETETTNEEANKDTPLISEADKEDKLSDTDQTPTVPDVVNKVNTADMLGKQGKNKDKSNDPSSVLDEVEPISELKQTLSILGLSDEKVKSLNNFVATSGKVVTTGNYRPFSGYVALQIDAGFENKNLKYHYRLPMVANWKSQAVYIKPDIIMPTVALYLDNKMGMSWQDKWYKFYPKTTQQLPLSMTTKNWLLAFKDSINALPANQFSQVNADALMPNIAYATQKIVTDGTIIHWQQTREQQQTFYRDIIERYIAIMDKQLDNASDKKALGKNEQTANEQAKAWQAYKERSAIIRV